MKIFSLRLSPIFLLLCACFMPTQMLAQDDTDTIKVEPRTRKSGNIVLVGEVPNVRAFAVFGGPITGGDHYGEMVKSFKEEFGPQVNVYSMIIPTASAYYTTEKAKEWCKDQHPIICHMYEAMGDSVIPVDIYDTLQAHKDEPIYLRTDHHWAPLAAYYAAKCFAKVAGVPFRGISQYNRQVVRNFVGTMPMYAKDSSVKRSPEDFVYYTPKDSDYTATFVTYTLGRDRKTVIKSSAPHEEPFFKSYKDGSSGAYCTFMGGDTRTVKVNTVVHNGRRLLILKDSYGNAIPGYLFGSFEEIHVADFRYFTHVAKYVRDNHITDVLFANNISHAYARGTTTRYEKILK